MTEHPITPSPELVEQWIANDDFPFATGTLDLVSITKDRLRSIATQAARWGADEELNACCDWVDREELWPGASTALRSDRRLGPFGAELKEQALEALNSLEGFTGSLEGVNTIRRALEALPDQP